MPRRDVTDERLARYLSQGEGIAKDRRAEVRDAAKRLLARHGSFPASQLADEVTSVGERTVRRYLAMMLEDGELRVVAGGRSTRYAAGESGGE